MKCHKKFARVCKSVRKRANVRSHISHPKKCRTRAHRMHVLKCFSHAHRNSPDFQNTVELQKVYWLVMKKQTFSKKVKYINIKFCLSKSFYSIENQFLNLFSLNFVRLVTKKPTFNDVFLTLISIFYLCGHFGRSDYHLVL